MRDEKGEERRGEERRGEERRLDERRGEEIAGVAFVMKYIMFIPKPQFSYVIITVCFFFEMAIRFDPMQNQNTTVLNNAANFLASALIGWAAFGEALPRQWFLGAGLIVAGVSLVAASAGGVARAQTSTKGKVAKSE